MDITCAGENCGLRIERQEAFILDEAKGTYLCLDCFTSFRQRIFSSSQSAVTGERKKRLKQLVRDEMAGIIPKDQVKEIVADQFRKVLLQQTELEDAAGLIANTVEVMCGPAIQRYRLKLIRGMRTAMEQALDKEEEEARADLQKYLDLGVSGA